MSASPPVAIVTGGSGGVGAALVQLLADRGYHPVVFDVAAAAGPDALTVDVTDAAAVQAAVSSVLDRYGRLDALVNNAALLSTRAADETTEEEWDRVMAVNVKGPYLVSRAAIPALRAAGGGSIVHVSSVHALASMRHTAAYAASKGALVSFSRQMAVDYADDHIRVNCVVLGSVRTAMSEEHGAAITRDGLTPALFEGELGRAAEPAEAARAIAFLLSPDASFVNASTFVVDGGMLARLM